MTKLPPLHFFRNRANHELLVSLEEQDVRDYEKLKITSEKNTDAKHLPNIEFFDEGLLITIGKSLHINQPTEHIERVVIQSECGLREWNVTAQARRGFPTAIAIPLSDAPKGFCNIFVCCSKRGVSHSTHSFPLKRYAFPAIMFFNNDAKQFVVRFYDLPELVAVGATKQEAYNEAKTELAFAVNCTENKDVLPTELQIVQQKHASAFMVEI